MGKRREIKMGSKGGDGSKNSGKVLKKMKRKNLAKGKIHIKSTYNNTIVALTDLNGGLVAWSSAGLLGFKGAKKATPYAATNIVNSLFERVKKIGLREVDVFVKGIGSGRESAVRAIASNGITIVSITDTTSIPHNGCRAPGPRKM